MSKTSSHKRYRAVVISPHLDDAVFSCGGAIAQMVAEGPVLVLNIFTRYLADVKIRGVVLSEKRYQEEAQAARLLGFESRNMGELDVSFRRAAYKHLGNIFRPPVYEDMQWLAALRGKVFAELAEIEYDEIYVPLGIGWHVDHVLTYLVFEPWKGRDGLIYYEDAPYCCIPHATRYRLKDIADYVRASADKSLAPVHHMRAWWQATMAYADTALMRNLSPWLIRKCATPVVAVYLYRLMGLHSQLPKEFGKPQLQSQLTGNDRCFVKKIDAMLTYGSQFSEFFSSRDDCIRTLSSYADGFGQGTHHSERFWRHPAQPRQFV